MCPTACLPNPLEHIIHTYHIETSSEQSRTCVHTRAQACMLLRSSCGALAGLLRVACAAQQGPYAVLCLFFLIDKCSQTEALISFSLKHVLVGVCAQSALEQTRQRSQTTMLREGCYSKWPNGKTKAVICACACACTCIRLRGLWSNG